MTQLRAAYRRELHDWTGIQDRRRMRQWLRLAERPLRWRAVHMAAFYALGDVLAEQGCPPCDVGWHVNRIIRGEEQPLPRMAPMVRMLRRTAHAVAS